jgi:hypothetical protein
MLPRSAQPCFDGAAQRVCVEIGVRHRARGVSAGIPHAIVCGECQRPSATRTEAAVFTSIRCQSMAGCANSAGIAREIISADHAWNDAERLLPQLTDLRKRISGRRCRDRLENAASKATLVLVRTLCRTAAFESFAPSRCDVPGAGAANARSQQAWRHVASWPQLLRARPRMRTSPA